MGSTLRIYNTPLHTIINVNAKVLSQYTYIYNVANILECNSAHSKSLCLQMVLLLLIIAITPWLCIVEFTWIMGPKQKIAFRGLCYASSITRWLGACFASNLNHNIEMQKSKEQIIYQEKPHVTCIAFGRCVKFCTIVYTAFCVPMVTYFWFYNHQCWQYFFTSLHHHSPYIKGWAPVLAPLGLLLQGYEHVDL